MIKRVCETCWFEFEARTQKAKYCSAGCKQKAHRIRNGQSSTAAAQKQQKSERKICPHCGGGFWQKNQGRKARYCSGSCRSSANRMKKAAAFKLFQEKLGYTYGGAYMAIGKGSLDAADAIAAQNGYHYSNVQRQYIRTQAYFSLDPKQLGIVW